MKNISKIFAFFAIIFIFTTSNLFAQTAPKVTKVDEITIKDILKPKGKPLLVNFWATWCVPCREEFPELVEIDKKYKGKIDFITISLDDLAEINRDVPKFLNEMKATMPAFLLRTTDENAVIGSISKDWEGGLPFTVLYNGKGEIVHTRQGLIKPKIVKGKIDKLLKPEAKIIVTEYIKIKNNKRKETIYYYENNWKLYRQKALKQGVIHSFELVTDVNSKTYDIALITRFADQETYDNVEKNFQKIIKETRPDGIKLLNAVKPADFRKNLSVKTCKKD